MTHAAARAIVHDYHRAWTSGDIDRAMKFDRLSFAPPVDAGSAGLR